MRYPVFSLNSGFFRPNPVLTSLIVKDLVVSRMMEVMSSESNLFSSSGIISRGLGLKTVKRCVANVSVLFSSIVVPVLFPDRQILVSLYGFP